MYFLALLPRREGIERAMCYRRYRQKPLLRTSSCPGATLWLGWMLSAWLELTFATRMSFTNFLCGLV
jgi:hypothetical protein